MLSGALNLVAQEARPLGNPAMWITTEDYPAAALRGEMEGVTGVQMSISAEGQVTGCTVTLSSGHPILDDLTCNLLRMRGRYEPAKDSHGQAIASQDNRRVRWQMPPDAAGGALAMHPQPFAMIVDFDVNERGEVENCTTRWQSGVGAGPGFCDGASGTRMQPFLNDKGEPVRKHLVYRTSMTIEDAAGAGEVPDAAASSATPQPN